MNHTKFKKIEKYLFKIKNIIILNIAANIQKSGIYLMSVDCIMDVSYHD